MDCYRFRELILPELHAAVFCESCIKPIRLRMPIRGKKQAKQEQRKVAERRLQESHAVLRALSQVSAIPGLGYDEQLTRALEIACEYLGLSLGIISRVEGSIYTVEHVFSADSDLAVKRGLRFELQETYCSETIRDEELIAEDNAGKGRFAAHPALEKMHLSSYIGIPVYVEGRIYGTLNFSSRHPRRKEFDSYKQDFVTLLAGWVGTKLEQLHAERRMQVASSALQQQIGLFQSVFHDSPHALVLTSPDHDIMLVNAAFLEQFNFSDTEVLGEPLAKLYADVKELILLPYLNEKIAKDVRPVRLQYKRENGEIFLGETVGTPVHSEDGTHLGYLTAIRDVTLEEEMARELEEKRLHSVQASRMATIGEMAGGIAHEVNNPLTIISGYARTLFRDLEQERLDPAKAKERLEKILRTVDRIVSIVQALRVMAREERSQEFSETPVLKIIDNVASLAEERFRHNGVMLELPAKEEIADLYLECHESQISQVLMNLVSNAFHAAKNTPEAFVRVNVSIEQGELVFAVADSGPGVPADLIQRIMEPFFTTRGPGEGTGLGLAISQRMVEDHNGILAYEPQAGRSCFVFRLPQTQSAIKPKKMAA